jgi:predicted esterase YcpF (UPF0227 family)
MVIIQIHGFNSGPGSKKVQLESAFPEAKVISPQLAYEPEVAIRQLQSIFDTLDQSVTTIHVIGTSLGAFYGLHLANTIKRPHTFFHLVNLSLMPHLSFKKFVNKTIYNYKTSHAFFVSESYVESFSTYFREIKARLNGAILSRLYFYEGLLDDEIDHSSNRQFFKSFEYPINWSIHEQSHRFEDLTPIIDQIIKIQKEIN